MGKAEQRCGQAPSVAILRQKNLSRTICRGEQRSPVLRICCKFRIIRENFFAAELAIILNCRGRRPRRPIRRDNAVIVVSLMWDFFGCRMGDSNVIVTPMMPNYIVQISQVQQEHPYKIFDRSKFIA